MAQKLRILSILGTRPEAVKMAPVIRAFASEPKVESLVCATGQHRQMLDQVLNLFEIVPDFDLDLMRPEQTLAEMTASILSHLDPLISNLSPDWVLVQGDTTTAMAGALASYYRLVPVAHVEAGLRTGNKMQPFPEEVNRRMVSVIADLHLAPTESNRQNLLAEGIPAARIVVTGNPVIDALQTIARQPEPLEIASLLQTLDINRQSGKQLILVTAHRRENFGKPLKNICEALQKLAERYGSKIQIVYPVHLNPKVREPVYSMLDRIDNITLLPPLDYLPWVHLLKHATLLLTDSGGLQEEAPGLGVPVLVLRQVTERPEGVKVGTVKLVGTDVQQILTDTCRLLDNPREHQAMAQAVNPYGDGRAAERIVHALLAHSA
jgi:UDP-N-acetylglucosamine 2-epimerase (non-hydrolysing)